MVYLIVLLVLKVALFLVPLHFGKLAYLEILQLADLRSQRTVRINYLLTDGTGIPAPEIAVEMPTRWRPGESQSVKYEIVSWGNSSQEIKLTLHSNPAFQNFETPITFAIGSEAAIEKEVTVPSDAYRNGIVSVQVIGEINLAEKRGLTQPTDVIVVSSEALRCVTTRTVEFVLLFLVTLVAAILFAVFVW